MGLLLLRGLGRLLARRRGDDRDGRAFSFPGGLSRLPALPGEGYTRLALLALMAGVLMGCSPVAEVVPAPAGPTAARAPTTTPTPAPPLGPHAQIVTADGRAVFVSLEVAATPEQRTVGLSKRALLPAGSGMLFVYPADHQTAFWMKDTWIPLSIAFISADGRILEIQDMEPRSEDLHQPAQAYRNALEVNRGFFENNGVKAGDRVELQLGGR